LRHSPKTSPGRINASTSSTKRSIAWSPLVGKIDLFDTKFEEHEIDKRKQLEVRVTAIEKHLGLDKKLAA
jgi:hypothetical protein